MTTTHNYSILSNWAIENWERLDEKKKKILDSIKMDLLETLKEDNVVNRNILADKLSKNRYSNWVSTGHGVPWGVIELNDSVSIDFSKKSIQNRYKWIFSDYDKALSLEPEEVRRKELDSIDTRFAEMLILDSWNFIEFRDDESFENDKNAEEESLIAYNELNKLRKYKRKIERIRKTDKNWDFYVIKWTDDQIKIIKERFEEELKKEGTPENEGDAPENEGDAPENGGDIPENRGDTPENDGETPDTEKEDKKENEDLDELRRKQEELEEKLRRNEKDNEELRNTIRELIEKLNKKEDTKDEEDGESHDDESHEDESHDEEDDDFFNDIDDIDDAEALDENPNYILRSVIVEQVVRIRSSNWYPEWTVEIRGESINIEEFEFYEELKQEYIDAKWDAEKLAQLDKEFAELIILFSPKGADFKDRYYIKLTEDELEDGLVVTNERLARYGITYNVTEYFEKIVEREVIRERKIVRKIETVITELETSIKELTRIIDIEKSSKEVILEEIVKRKSLLKILLRRQRKLLLLLTGNKNGEEIKKLRDKESKLQKEYEDLLAEKKKQEELKGKIVAVKKKIAELENDDEKKKIAENIEKKEKEISEIEEEIKKLQKRKWFIKDQLELNDLGLSPDRIAGYNEELKDIDNQIAGYQADIEKLNEDIKALKEQLEKDESEELKKLRDELKDLEGQLAWMDPDIDEKLKKKEEELDEIKKQIKKLEQAWGDNEIQAQLIALIEEQEELIRELETLERLVIVATTEEEKIRIREQIRIINKKITIISKRITEYEHEIQIYKERVTTRRYRIYQAAQATPVPVPSQGLQLNSVISDMWTDVFEEKAALKVEEQLKQEYKNLWTWDVFGRLALFLGRWRKRRRMMNREKNNIANTAFLTDPTYAALNEQSQNAADRHAHELATGMVAINRITTVHNPQVDQLCKDYLDGIVTDAQFQTQFNGIVAADPNIQNALNGQNITHIGSNILLRLNEQRDLNNLIENLDNELAAYIANPTNGRMNNMQNMVEAYIRNYQKTPAFMTDFEDFVWGDLNARNKLKRFLAQQKAVMKMQVKNLIMNIDIINKWKSAYQIDNTDREKGWKFKVWKFMDKHPWGTAIGSIVLGVWLWAATAWVGAVAWAAITTGVFGAYVGTTNAIKKWTHHTKEQNTHEKNVVTDYRNEQQKIQQWQNDALNGSWWRKYKAKRQLALYDQTTQENIQLTKQIEEYITNLSSKTWPLTPQEDNFMRCNLIEGWARLKYYREMWHNFLASENVDSTEKDMMRLEKAITLWLQKINETTTSIENTMTATNGLGANITYDVIRNDLKASYDKSLIQFKRERRNLALKYGIGTAAVSIGTALGLQYLTGTGVFAKWTAPVAPTTTSHSWWTDNFALWRDEVLLPGDIWYTANPSGIHDSTVAALTGAPKWSTVTFTYGVWTDATPVIPWRLTSMDLWSKLSSVGADINSMSWLTTAQKWAFLSELSSLSHSWFTNNNLASMRAAEYLQHCAQAMSDCAATNPDVSTYIPAFSRTLGASGWTYNSLAERFMTWAIDITTPGKPWTDPVKRWRWLMWVPLFFNTFKDRKGIDDTTDQKWNNQNAQQQQQQPNNP